MFMNVNAIFEESPSIMAQEMLSDDDTEEIILSSTNNNECSKNTIQQLEPEFVTIPNRKGEK